MHNSAQQLLGQWVVQLVLRYFGDQKSIHSDKLFIKIAGIDDSAWGDVLQVFRSAEDKLAVYYRPTLRTLKKVEGFETYQCQTHETSTWLRNNTMTGNALLIFMNDQTPEAQSLENIFTIDEARLLGAEGLKVLYQLYAETNKCFGEELNTLKQFMEMYYRIAEPQLRSVLSFLVAISQDLNVSMVDKIQKNLDQLGLFRDQKLPFKISDGLPRLRRNDQLSRLEKEGRTTKKEEFIENLYQFLHKETGDQYLHELWDRVKPDVFKQQALDFIHNRSTELLQYEFEHVSQALLYRVRKLSFNEKVNDFVSAIESQSGMEQERKKLVSDALEAIDENRNPELVQEFVDEFSDELQDHPTLRKEMERLVARMRQYPTYSEIGHALMQESVRLLADYLAEVQVTRVHFVLRVLNDHINERLEAAMKFHLLQLERLTGFIRFDETSIQTEKGKDKDSEISFQLQLFVEDKKVSDSKFKLVKAFEGELAGMIESMQDHGCIPYLRIYFGPETKWIDVCEEIKSRVSGYVAAHDLVVKEAAETFYRFVTDYTTQLQRAWNYGLSSLDFAQLETRLSELLRQSHRSALVSRHIFQYINCLGSIDHYDVKSQDTTGYAKSRILTLLNPIRLLSYVQRLARVKTELQRWIDHPEPPISEAYEIDVYLNRLQEETARLSPQYFVLDGVNDQFLIEQQELMGEGTFTLNGNNDGEDQLVQTFAEEFLSTVRTYLEVYPYARDCLDIVFLYCPHADYVTSAVNQIFKHTNIRKVKVLVHSGTNGAAIYEYLNGWICQEESYAERYYSFPKVEIQVIAEHSINGMMQSVSQYLMDADIGVLVNYFGQSSHIQYKLEKVHVQSSSNWFDTIYKEPYKKDDAVKRVSFVSEKLPKVMQYFYQLQYVLFSSESLAPDEHYLLRHVISISKLADTELINYMHKQFNWSLFIDRYLDKSLLRRISSEAQIIKYKSKAGSHKDYRTLLSSSKYIRKLVNEQSDHAYYDRLYHKYVQLLKNDKIDFQTIVKATERVKDISGGVVLRAIGPGKFAHEMLAMYLSTETRPICIGELVVWSVCDELPWFQGAVRRPDLVRTSLSRDGERIRIHFELIELKLISHTIFETERYDAIKQVKAGLELYRKRFSFSEYCASAELWRQELVYYLLEYGTYNVEDALLLKQLQDIKLECIDVSMSGSIDTFVYTSNLHELSIMDGNVNGYQTELLLQTFTNHIYNRAYLLNALGVAQEVEIPSYETPQDLSLSAFVSDRLSHETNAVLGLAVSEGLETEIFIETELQTNFESEHKATEVTEIQKQAFASLAYVATGIETTGVTTEVPMSQPSAVTEPLAGYPEQIALKNEPRPSHPNVEDVKPLVDSYHMKLRHNFNQLGIPIKVVDSFVGVSVIRLIVEIPADKPYSAIASRANEIYLWLKLGSVPLIALRNGAINIDINRTAPETVYFENFMEQTREKFPLERLKGRLIAPIGVGQLRELIWMDFSSPNTPHLLIGGTTGSGKSVTINAIILAMMCLYDPVEVQFLFVDPKKVEFLTYENRSHTKQVLTEIEEAVTALEQLVEEMEDRYRLFACESVSSIDQYVEVTGLPLPRLVVVFDEFADFMEREKNLSGRVENAILRLGAKARAAGIHLLICTQNPKADIVPTNIRNNLPARLALKAADHHASKIIINEEGAEKLGGKGDFLVRLDAPEIIRAKSPYLTPRVKRALLQYFNRNTNP